MQVQKNLSERTGDTPAVAGVPAVGRALARVLSVVAQEEGKENDLESLSFPLESGQLPVSPSPQQLDLPSTHRTSTSTITTGKIHHLVFIFLIVELQQLSRLTPL